MKNDEAGKAAEKAMKNFLSNIVLEPLENKQNKFLPKLKTTVEDSVAVSLTDIGEQINNTKESINKNGDSINDLGEKFENLEIFSEISNKIKELDNGQEELKDSIGNFSDSVKKNEKEFGEKLNSLISDIENFNTKWDKTAERIKEINARVDNFEEIFKSSFTKELDAITQSVRKEKKENKKILYVFFAMIFTIQLITIFLVVT